MFEIDKIPLEVLDSLRENNYTDEQIRKMKPKDMFIIYCEWEGLINYGSSLWDYVVELQKLVQA